MMSRDAETGLGRVGYMLIALLCSLAFADCGFAQESDEKKNAKPAEKALSPLEVARQHLQRGRYEEAADAYEALLKSDSKNAAAVVGLSRTLEASGDEAAAVARLEAFLKAQPKAVEVSVRRAEIAFERGQIEDAEKSADVVLEADSEHLRARWLKARCLVERGQIKEAADAFRWFVRYYNKKQPEDAESLLLIGEGSAVYARWNGVSDIFTFIINTLCPDALKADEHAWLAHYMSGSLLLEKYNRAQGLPDLNKALAINPQAVEVLTALGWAALDRHELEKAETYSKQALEARPKSVLALQLKTDLQLMSGAVSDALETAQQAAAINAKDQGTLARIAACYYLIDGKAAGPEGAAAIDKRLSELLDKLDDVATLKIEKPTRLEQLLLDLGKRNPRPGRFLVTFADQLTALRKFGIAEKSYQRAIALMPQLPEAKTALGMLYMQTGRTDKAKETLDAAFKADPYHVRVSNMRKVLGVLGGYETITTDHFVIRVDSKADAILAEYMAEYLEECYAELTKLYGFEPATRTTFEIYHDAKGVTAHEWFSARLVGLPWIQTIGASTGMMVALASPTAVKKPFNWARVLKHEFVHIVTLQQTGFNIPHWFTEALAVTSEGLERTAVWNRLLLERVPQGKLWKLDELNHIFARPETPENWQFAYCQSRLYAQFMIEKHGAESIAKLLDAYRRNLATKDAIQEVFKQSADEFHQRYVEYVTQQVEAMSGIKPTRERTLAELEKDASAAMDDASKVAAYADGLLKANRREDARDMAEKAANLNPKEPMAAVVLAELELLGKDTKTATSLLEAVFDDANPHPRVLGLLGKLCLQSGRFEDASHLFELGREKFGGGKFQFAETDEWSKGLVAAYVKLKQDDKLKTLLESMAKLDGDDPTVRKKLASMALEAEDWANAKRWAMEAVQIDVKDVAVHEMLAQAFEKLGDKKRAEREQRIMKELK